MKTKLLDAQGLPTDRPHIRLHSTSSNDATEMPPRPVYCIFLVATTLLILSAKECEAFLQLSCPVVDTVSPGNGGRRLVQIPQSDWVPWMSGEVVQDFDPQFCRLIFRGPEDQDNFPSWKDRVTVFDPIMILQFANGTKQNYTVGVTIDGCDCTDKLKCCAVRYGVEPPKEIISLQDQVVHYDLFYKIIKHCGDNKTEIGSFVKEGDKLPTFVAGADSIGNGTTPAPNATIALPDFPWTPEQNNCLTNCSIEFPEVLVPLDSLDESVCTLEVGTGPITSDKAPVTPEPPQIEIIFQNGTTLTRELVYSVDIPSKDACLGPCVARIKLMLDSFVDGPEILKEIKNWRLDLTVMENCGGGSNHTKVAEIIKETYPLAVSDSVGTTPPSSPLASPTPIPSSPPPVPPSGALLSVGGGAATTMTMALSLMITALLYVH